MCAGLNFWTISAFVLACGALAILGCGSKGPTMVQVNGTVSLDGQPVEGATVSFMPKSGSTPAGNSTPASGSTDSAGKFTLSTLNPGDGAIVGSYSVTVSKSKITGGQQGDPNNGKDGKRMLSGPPSQKVTTEYLIPRNYSIPGKSGLSDVEVKSGMQPVELKLTSK
jgi:hypothetical protein